MPFIVAVVVFVVVDIAAAAAAVGTSRHSLPSINLSRVFVCVWVCEISWVYNQVNAFAKCLVQHLNNEVVAALPTAVTHTPRASQHMYCICVPYVCVCAYVCD